MKPFSFNSQAYLSTYYSRKPEDDYGEDASLYWFHHIYTDFAPKGKLLEFGGGPTIYSLISAAKHFDEIHFSDVVEDNIRAVQQWKDKIGHDWSAYIRRVLEFEAVTRNCIAIQQREELLRNKITRFYQFDQRFPPDKFENYEALSVQFVPDSSAGTIDEFRANTKNILGYLKLNGLLIMGVLKRSHFYRVGEVKIPAVYLTEDTIETQMQSLGIEILRMASFSTFDTERGVGGYIYFAGKKIRNAEL